MLLALVMTLLTTAPSVTPLLRAHAHNDYLHPRPLLDALDNGFTSIEADVHLENGQLLVAHELSQTSPDRTLQRLYLDPLSDRIHQNHGSVFGDGTPLTLLVDLKSKDPQATYAALNRALKSYEPLLTHFDSKRLTPGPLLVIVTGNKPCQMIAAQGSRLVAIDGTLADLASDPPPALVPWISINWTDHFQWDGRGDFAPSERRHLLDLVRQVHAQQRRIRFWAAPDNETAWQALLSAGVDYINTNHLEACRRFLNHSN